MSTPYDVYDGPDDYPVCPICGSGDVGWVDCPQCGGDGGFYGDVFGDGSLYFDDRAEWETCHNCHGDGGWWQCWNSDKHPKQEGGND